MNKTLLNIRKTLPPDVKLVAVSKGRSINQIKKLISSQHFTFAENKVQETKQKWLDLKKQFPKLRLHMIGNLQKNKIKDALKIFDVIETIDSIELAKKIIKEVTKHKYKKEFFIQVNMGDEIQKHGVSVSDADELINFCQANLNLVGLMCIPPQNKDPKSYFQKLIQIAKKHHLQQISMGMSDDYQIAIKCGATQIRLGRALFG